MRHSGLKECPVYGGVLGSVVERGALYTEGRDSAIIMTSPVNSCNIAKEGQSAKYTHPLYSPTVALSHMSFYSMALTCVCVCVCVCWV